MITPDIQQAKEWVTYVNGQRDLYGDKSVEARAAARVIQSLPDQWIDAEKVREIYDRYRASETTLHEAFRAAVALATPPLQTLAELIEAGDKPEDYQWMQAQVFPTASTLGIITGVDEYAHLAIILFADGRAKNVPWRHITPLPDAPKLVWPSLSVSDKSEPVSVETEDVTEESRTALPRQEDVPEGEAWIVEYDGIRHVGTREKGAVTYLDWALARLDGTECVAARDAEITLVSRLVPEAKP